MNFPHDTSTLPISVGLSAWLTKMLSAGACLYLSYVLFSVWRTPMAWADGAWVPFGVGILVIEFLIVHASGFVSAFTLGPAGITATRKLQFMAGLAAFYLLMVGAMALSTGGVALIGVFAGVMLGRLMTAWQAGPADRPIIAQRAAFSVVAYLAVVFASVLIEVPAWGITTEVLNEVYPHRGSGEWEREPQRAIAGGAVYFAVMGIAELTLFRPRAPAGRATPSTADR